MLTYSQHVVGQAVNELEREGARPGLRDRHKGAPFESRAAANDKDAAGADVIDVIGEHDAARGLELGGVAGGARFGGTASSKGALATFAESTDRIGDLLGDLLGEDRGGGVGAAPEDDGEVADLVLLVLLSVSEGGN